MDAGELLARCSFPAAGTSVELAVSGGPDSLGLALLAIEHGLDVRVHHVDHHSRGDSGADAEYVEACARRWGVAYVRHDVVVAQGANFEARARDARRLVLPEGVLTGHTMDDLVETVWLNMMRGAGLDGLSPLVGDSTKPMTGLRRTEVRAFVEESGYVPRLDPTNDDPRFRRNRVRHELMPLIDDIAERDVVPIIARQAALIDEERRWLDDLSEADRSRALGDIDTRELVQWPPARLRRWLRHHLARVDSFGRYPPSADEVARALDVVRGVAKAAELSGGRRLGRRARRLSLGEDSTTLSPDE